MRALTARVAADEAARKVALAALAVVRFGLNEDAQANGGTVDRLAVAPYVDDAIAALGGVW